MLSAMLIAFIPAAAVVVAAWIGARGNKQIKSKLDHEFSANSGKSARDLLDRIASEQLHHSRRLDDVNQKLDRHLRDHL